MPIVDATATLLGTGTITATAWTRIDDRAQALEYRRQQQAREDNRLVRERALAGDNAAVARVEAAWDPLRPWAGWDPERKVIGEPE